jgi:hypothetical protein
MCGGEGISWTEVALPVGISFYTFQALSYTIDLYRGRCEVQRSYAKLLLYISFFPQLIAGPIVRYRDIAEQIDDRSVTLDRFAGGTARFIEGLGKKVLLANTFAAKADADVYYSSDTHWNKIGAQIACRELVRVICEEEAVTEPAGAFVTVDKELVSDTKFIVGGEKRGDLQKLAKLGKAYNSTEYEPEQPLKRVLISEERDRNDEAVWEHYNSSDDGAVDAKVYLTGDSFRWNMAPFLEEAVSDTVVTSRYYLDTDDLLNEEPEVFVYMIAERYLHDLAMIPGYNTAALVNTN